MLFVCQPKILHEALFSVSLNYFNSFLTPKRNLKQSAYATFLGDKQKEHYGMLWYFL